MPIKQDSRLLGIKTPLGPDVLAVSSVTIKEQLSRLFHIEAELISDEGTLDLDKVVGHDVTLRLNVGQSDKRYFHGFVSRMSQSGNESGYACYTAEIVPWLWFLTRTSDCCIFQEMTVPDIIEDVFKYYGFTDYKLKLSGDYPKWEYCVQYRETDFNFVSRLMEQEGIYYFFEHEDGKHTLVLANSISAHKAFPDYEEVTFSEAEGDTGQREVINDWTIEKEVQPVAYSITDFDFTKPKTSLLAKTNVSRKYGKAEYELFDYPGEYDDHGEGDRLTAVRLNELQCQYEVVHGDASSRGLAAGHTFKLKSHPRDDQNRDYLIIETSMSANAGEIGGADGAGEFFSCSFSAIEKKQQYRAPRLTPKPIIQGPQTAIVVGPGGEEIHTDKYGRVKVHFHWDRHDKADENSSCWIRVSQYWAGKEWGSMHIPRMGQEVIVEFLEGDPDCPIITGRVYNADQTVPYALPGNKTQSGIKSRSSKGGSGANFNEIRFEDKKGSEEVYIHAEKDQNNVVEHDETTKVGHDRTEDVANDEAITIANDRGESVGRNETISIGKDRTEDVAKNETISIGENRTTSVGKNDELSVGVNHTVEVGENETVTVEKDRKKSIGKNETVSVGENLQETIGKNQAVKVGKGFVLDVADEITIKTGSASISMKKDGTIAIKGKDVTVEGSGKIKIKADSDVIVKGSKITQN